MRDSCPIHIDRGFEKGASVAASVQLWRDFRLGRSMTLEPANFASDATLTWLRHMGIAMTISFVGIGEFRPISIHGFP